MENLFRMDNPFWRFMGKLVDAVALNILWFICCIPIVTIGPSTTALYYVSLKSVRDEEGYLVRSFFKSFKENLKQGIIITLILLALAIVGGTDMYFYIHNTGTVYQILKLLFLAVALFYLVEIIYVFPVLAKFTNTVKITMKNALLLGVRHLPKTILIIGIHIAVVLLIWMFPPAIIFGMGLVALLSSYVFVGIFDRYIPREEDERNRYTPEEWEEIQKADQPVKSVVYSVDDPTGEATTSQILKQREEVQRANEAQTDASEEEPKLSKDEMMLL